MALHCATLCYAVKYNVLHCTAKFFSANFSASAFRALRFGLHAGTYLQCEMARECARVLYDGGRVEDIGLALALWMLFILHAV